MNQIYNMPVKNVNVIMGKVEKLYDSWLYFIIPDDLTYITNSIP